MQSLRRGHQSFRATKCMKSCMQLLPSPVNLCLHFVALYAMFRGSGRFMKGSMKIEHPLLAEFRPITIFSLIIFAHSVCALDSH